MTIETSYFKGKLEEERKLLEAELKSIAAPKPENKKDWDEKEPSEEGGKETADLNLAADRQEEIEGRHALTDTLEVRYREVLDALSRIDKGNYGICFVCGNEIEKERLEANSAATTCKAHLKE